MRDRVAVLQLLDRQVVAGQLPRLSRLDVPSMVLEIVGQFVVDIYWAVDVFIDLT